MKDSAITGQFAKEFVDLQFRGAFNVGSIAYLFSICVCLKGPLKILALRVGIWLNIFNPCY